MKSVRIFSVREPDLEGTGDARRAASVVAALQEEGVSVRVTALLPGAARLSGLLRSPRALLRLILAATEILFRRTPVQVALVRAAARPEAIAEDELPVFLTARTVPPNPRGPFVVDFVDSLSENLRRRAEFEARLRWFWKAEAKRMQRWESRCHERAVKSFAVSSADARLLGPRTITVPIEIDGDQVGAHDRKTRRVAAARADAARSPRARTILFAGSLFYRPNEEAVLWLVDKMVPELTRAGWDPAKVIIAGRAPSRVVRDACSGAGVTLLRDVPDLMAEMKSAGVMCVPLALGSGVQNKVLNAWAAGCPLVITPRANRGLDLPPGPDLRVAERDPALWTGLIEDLLGCDVDMDDREAILAKYRPEAVRQRWRDELAPLLK